MLPFTTHIKRGELCAFMIGHGHFIRETQVSVESVIQFMPGMTIAVAVRNEVYSVYNRWAGVPFVLFFLRIPIVVCVIITHLGCRAYGACGRFVKQHSLGCRRHCVLPMLRGANVWLRLWSHSKLVCFGCLVLKLAFDRMKRSF